MYLYSANNCCFNLERRFPRPLSISSRVSDWDRDIRDLQQVNRRCPGRVRTKRWNYEATRRSPNLDDNFCFHFIFLQMRTICHFKVLVKCQFIVNIFLYAIDFFVKLILKKYILRHPEKLQLNTKCPSFISTVFT